ncbi:hypothetical protein LP419_15635 [Massilia sp. H-1]|nr:hypothetical protein LP419_15635 [Massilia sp. H-1]
MTPARLALFASVAAMGIGLLVLWPDPALPPVGLGAQTFGSRAVASRQAASGNRGTKPAIGAHACPLRKTDNYAAFIQDAMQRPDEGGLFYATLAFHRCKRAAPPVEAKWAGMTAPCAPRPCRRGRDTSSAARQRGGAIPGRSWLHAGDQAGPRGALDVLAPDGIPSMARSAQDAQRAYARAQALGDPYLVAITLEADAPYLVSAIDPVFANGANDDVFRSRDFGCRVRAARCLRGRRSKRRGMRHLRTMHPRGLPRSSR